ncbi:methyltransferase domain-containing protein [Verrucomicrobiales bacterium]|jgi:arsenite methyltransferase|nr:methyltransferase domain-containing protein [Verrucomicrobiales bacterium]|tara:strand:- start:705 stop:1865 length:1161 start_codon:yes stop_codon:yes gene_type:complete
MKTETVVKDRYADGANAREEALCCPVEYDAQYLKIIPTEVIERDYGCGDPSQYVKEGETVLDLGSGTGKICFIASQVVGPTGKVIGVDMTDDMLEVARRNAPIVAERAGHDNVEFRKGRIQDLALDLEALEARLKENPVTDANGYVEAEELADELRIKQPLVESDSVDVVVSNCVLNLVSKANRRQMFEEIHRVLKRGGRAVISDIVCDEDVPQDLQDDAELWSGCISGAFLEDEFLQAFEDAGFYGVSILKFDKEPWQTVKGIEFRSMTIEAYKGKEGVCLERNQAVIYKGPFKKVLDDDGHAMERGKRYAVCDKIYNIYRSGAYEGMFEFVEPQVDIPLEEAGLFDCSQTLIRDPRQTKGADYDATTEASDCCSPDDSSGSGCC